MALTSRVSLMSSDSSWRDSDAQTSTPDPDLSPSLLDNSGLSRIFIDAVEYSEVISRQDGDDKEEDSGESVDRRHDDHEATTHRVADLLGRDLNASEVAASERFAKFSVMKESDVLSGIDLPADTDEKEEVTIDEGLKSSPTPFEQDIEFQDTIRTTSVSQLSSEEIVKLLVDEFGPLAVNGDDTEQLVWETDGAYLQEVAILGVIHLTTHRLTFHASLLSTRPDLLPDKQIIRTGPVTIHRSGWHRKRRYWLELSHDMLTIFPSSKEEDRIRPIRSYLLSAIKKVYPEDENNKRVVKVEFTSEHAGDHCDRYAEFDTEESAAEWRRELQGAVFMYRRNRASYLGKQSEDERGVQISIPLSRIKSFVSRSALKYDTILNIELSSGELRTSISDSESDSDESEKGSSPSEDDTDMGLAIEFGVPRSTRAWDDIGQRIAEAKEREQCAGVTVPPRVTVDFGALNFVQRHTGLKVEDSQKASIRHALAISEDEELWYTRAGIARSVISWGYFIISSRYIGFWAKALSIKDSKYRFPISKVAGARSTYRYLPHVFGMALLLREHPPMHFDFTTEERRDEVVRRIGQATRAYQLRRTSSMPPSPPSNLRARAIWEPVLTSEMGGNVYSDSPMSITPLSCTTAVSNDTSRRNATFPPSPTSPPTVTVSHVLSPLSHTIRRVGSRYLPRGTYPKMPKIINLPPDTLPRYPSMHFVCLTIGSRGDVQPYIALGQTLKEEGHRVTIVTHEEYKEWVEAWGLQHRTAGGDPGALMKLSVDHKMFSPQFFKESIGNFRTWLDDLLIDAWETCKDADVLLESPSAMAGVHIAEALNIPYFRTFTMPWSKTTAFPHPFLSSPVELAQFNASTYVLFDNILWNATCGQINRWRKNTLHIKETDMSHLAQSKIPFIYNFSPSVVPKPLDWGDHITISGYWFVDNPDLGWTAPDSLIQWMEKARRDGKPIVYIGFGSITVPNPSAMTRSIVKAVKKSGVRAIISKGWSARMTKSEEPTYKFPPECYPIDKIPHDWLFPQIDAALHHGGAGTTGASLRAGIPTLVKPWFGDQFFWASRVQKVGAGMRVSLNPSELASALTRATSDRIMKERAASVGANVRKENGTLNALHAIYIYLDRAGRIRKERD